MDLKDTITKWHSGMCLLEDENCLDEAVSMLLSIKAPSAKIFHNIGCIRMRQTLYSDAIQFFNSAIDRDKYLALSYFQRGVCYHEINRYDRAELDFLTAQSMCPKEGINYRQLGADFILMSEHLGQFLKVTRQTFGQRNGGHLPVLDNDVCLFWPPKKMVENLVKQDFLGKAKVISSTEERDIIYAADKVPSSSYVSQRSRHSASSASLRKQVIVMPGGAEIVVPPRPNRPPPSLPENTASLPTKMIPGGQLRREKSKSAEDILDSEPQDVYSLAKAVVNSSSGSRLNIRSDLASVLSQQMKSGKTQTLPNHKSVQAVSNFHGNHVLQGKSQFVQDRMPCTRQHLKPAKPQRPPTHTIASEKTCNFEPDEIVIKKTVRELATGFSQLMLAVKSEGASGGVAKPPKPPRPPPPQRNKHSHN